MGTATPALAAAAGPSPSPSPGTDPVRPTAPPRLVATLVAVVPLRGPLAVPGPARPAAGRAAVPDVAALGSADRCEPADPAGARAPDEPGPDLAVRGGTTVNEPEQDPELSRPAPGPYASGPAHGPHLPLRPLWICRRCGHPWPCAVARLALLAEYRDDRVGLHVYLGAALFAATTDLCRLDPNPGPDPATLFARFLGWARPRL